MKSEPQEKKVELIWNKCEHNLELVKKNEARCSKCGVGYMGHDVQRLIDASKR